MSVTDDAWKNDAKKPNCFHCGRPSEIKEEIYGAIRTYCSRCYVTYVVDPEDKNNFGKDGI